MQDDDWDGFGDNTAAEAPAVEAAEDPFAGDDAFGSQPNAAPSEESAPINDDSGFDFGSSEPTAAPVEAAPVENGLGGGMERELGGGVAEAAVRTSLFLTALPSAWQTQ